MKGDVLKKKVFFTRGSHKQTLGRAKKRLKTYKYKYNGKELQDELGLNLYDYGWRNYMPDIGRWTQIDPLAEKFASESPYAYVNNDPLGFSDIDGKDYIMTIQYDKNGKFTGVNISGTVYIQGSGANIDRASELNKYAKENIKGGEGVTIDINYAFDKTKNEKNLKSGENILTFDEKPDNNENVSHVTWETFSNKEFKNRWLTGNTGTIYGSGKDNHTVIHETLHLFGLADRYDDYRQNNAAVDKITVPFEGFENNIMGSNGTSLHKVQYQQWFEHAKSRAKANNNPTTIIGKMAVDRVGGFMIMPNGARRAQKN